MLHFSCQSASAFCSLKVDNDTFLALIRQKEIAKKSKRKTGWCFRDHVWRMTMENCSNRTLYLLRIMKPTSWMRQSDMNVMLLACTKQWLKKTRKYEHPETNSRSRQCHGHKICRLPHRSWSILQTIQIFQQGYSNPLICKFDQWSRNGSIYYALLVMPCYVPEPRIEA